MKKYMVLAILPILFQSSASAGDAAVKIQEAKAAINQAIMPQLQAAQTAMRDATNLEFDSIVPALVLFSGDGRNDKAVIGIANMQNIKKALELFEAQEKKKLSYYSWLMGSSVLVQQIKIQIAYIDKALSGLVVKKGSSISIAAILGYAALWTIAAVAIRGYIVNERILNDMDDFSPFTKNNLIDHWAKVIASYYIKEENKDYHSFLSIVRESFETALSDVDDSLLPLLNKTDKATYNAKYAREMKVKCCLKFLELQNMIRNEYYNATK